MSPSAMPSGMVGISPWSGTSTLPSVLSSVFSESDSAIAAIPSSVVVDPEALTPSSLEVTSTRPSETVIRPPSMPSSDPVTVTSAPSRITATSAWTPSSPVARVRSPEDIRMPPLAWTASSPESTSTVPPSTMTYTPPLMPLVDFASSEVSLPAAAPPPAEMSRSLPVMMTSVAASMPSPAVVVSFTVPPEMLT